jgi:outer membrane immunogenic protein
MSDTLIARSALVAAFLIPFAGSAFAQSADDRSNAALEKEIAALRAKVHRLELEKEVTGLHGKLDQLGGRRPVQSAATDGAQVAPYPLVTRIETNSRGRTLVMADMPMKAAPPPVAYYSWTGFYLGGNIGYGVGSNRAQATDNIVFGAAPVLVNTMAADAAVAPAGAIGGVQFGYNWQAGANWLVGLETDLQGSAQKATSCTIECDNTPGAGRVPNTFTTMQSLQYFGTIRGRLGVADRGTLFYATAGGAYGRLNETLDLRFAGSELFNSTSDNKFGWVAGGGIESSLGGNWTAKVEYLYMDLGTITATLGGALAPPQSIAFTNTTKLHDNIVRAGLNYRFGPSAGPVSAYNAMAAAPPQVISWTGFYVGANVGYGFGNDHNQTDFQIPSDSTGTAFGVPGTSVTPKGGLGGVQVGYNVQAAPHWLVGLEADFQGTAQDDTACASAHCNIETSQGTVLATEFLTVQHQLDYFGTLRGRLGFVSNNTLFYATGGGALGHVRETVHGNFAGELVDQGTGKDLAGYAVGGGIEAMLPGGWSAKAEYLYLNLGGISTNGDYGNGFLTVMSNSTVRDHVVRLGANYHFGAAPY